MVFYSIRCLNSLRSLQQDRRGAIAMMSGLMAMGLVLFTGLAIDAARINTGRQALQDAVDSAALAGAISYTADTAPQRTIAINAARSDFASYISPSIWPNWIRSPAITGNPVLTASTSPNGFEVQVTATAQVDTTIMQLVGQKTITEQVTATAINPKIVVKFSNPFFGDQLPADWDQLWVYPVPQSGSTYSYNTVPGSATMTAIGDNCENYYNWAYAATLPGHDDFSWDQNKNLSRCWLAPYNARGQGQTGARSFNLTYAATQPFGIALENMTAGRMGSYEKDTPADQAHVSPASDIVWPWGYANEYGSQPGNINWFYSSLAKASETPSSQTDAINRRNGVITNYSTGNTPGYASYPNSNCSLVVTVNGAGGPAPTNGPCFNTGGTDPAFQNGTLSCAAMKSNSYTYYWNDMGQAYDNFNFTSGNGWNGASNADISITVACGAGANQVRLIK